MADLPQAYVVHETPSRLRLKVPARRHDKAFFGAAARMLSERAPAARIDANPVTASILICGPDSARLIRELDEGGPFRLSTEPESQIGELGREMQALNRRLLNFSAGRIDARAYIVLALLVSAMVQIARGRVFAPAVTLLWYAGEAIRAWTPDETRR
ncbi:hypothetical protein WOC76_03185 [Methylocystis sp. IM3]|uniref:hypothetical protein n=1 Tax=unclassified Methylocystis TaxID=2625913 RepID=UPI000F99E2BF|nr:MAG: hypothetical protein EKK29_16950 [Hyphomicrobiales bacterium]